MLHQYKPADGQDQRLLVAVVILINFVVVCLFFHRPADIIRI